MGREGGLDVRSEAKGYILFGGPHILGRSAYVLSYYENSIEDIIMYDVNVGVCVCLCICLYVHVDDCVYIHVHVLA